MRCAGACVDGSPRLAAPRSLQGPSHAARHSPKPSSLVRCRRTPQRALTRAALSSGESSGGPPPQPSRTLLESIAAAPGEIVTAVKAFPGTVVAVVQGAGATGAALVVANTPGVPDWARREHSEVASARGEEVFATVFSGGDKAKWRRDVSFYIDGFARLSRDLYRDRELIFADPAGLDDRLKKRRDASIADLRALVPFMFLVMNTFPLTPLFVGPMIDRMPQWRSLWLPSQFGETRLAAVRRLRAIREREGPSSSSVQQQEDAEER